MATWWVAEDFAKKVSILDAIHIIARAWRSVKVTAVVNSFQKALSLDEKDTTMADIKELDALIPDGMTSKEFQAFLYDDDELDDTQNDKVEEVTAEDKNEA